MGRLDRVVVIVPVAAALLPIIVIVPLATPIPAIVIVVIVVLFTALAAVVVIIAVGTFPRGTEAGAESWSARPRATRARTTKAATKAGSAESRAARTRSAKARSKWRTTRLAAVPVTALPLAAFPFAVRSILSSTGLWSASHWRARAACSGRRTHRPAAVRSHCQWLRSVAATLMPNRPFQGVQPPLKLIDPLFQAACLSRRSWATRIFTRRTVGTTLSISTWVFAIPFRTPFSLSRRPAAIAFPPSSFRLGKKLPKRLAIRCRRRFSGRRRRLVGRRDQRHSQKGTSQRHAVQPASNQFVTTFHGFLLNMWNAFYLQQFCRAAAYGTGLPEHPAVGD